MNVRAATNEDIDDIMEIISQAKSRMRLSGSEQWRGDYPARENIVADISASAGYVMTDSDGTIAYMALSFDGEPAYASLDSPGESRPYATAHRLAVADRALKRGVATAFMRSAERIAIERGVRLFRADTNFDNAYMLRIFERLGFLYCGEVRYLSGSRRAYQKELEE